MTTIEQRNFETCIAQGKPYFGRYMHAFQGDPVRHAYMNRFVEMVSAVDPTRPLRILEVGSWAGGSAVTWANALKEHHKGCGSVVCVDSWKPYFDPDSYGEPGGSIYHSMHQALCAGDILQLFLHNVRATGNEDCVLTMIGESNAVLPLLSEAAFDIVFIDGAHDFNSVRNDLRNASRLVAEGGILCGDDLEMQLSQVDSCFAAENGHLDYICDPKSGVSYHPGVALAVAEIATHVSSWNGLWAMRKENGRLIPLQQDLFSDREVVIPAHIPVGEICLPTLVVHGHRGFNIISYLDKLWGVAQSLGPMDLASVDAERIDMFMREGAVMTGSTLEEVMKAIDGALSVS